MARIDNFGSEDQRLFIGNLSFGCSEEILRTFIREAGFEVDSVTIMQDAETAGKNRGFGFVNLAEGVSVIEAIGTLNGASLQGRALTVNKALPRKRKE